MSGHSKWSTIKHKKGVTDARRGKLFTKLAKEIIVAARQGGEDIDKNFRLRLAIQKAKDSNMPNDTIHRAVKKASGASGSGEQMAEVVYEGYGPGGTAVLVEVLTDNKNRSVSAIRSTFTKGGGNLAESGAVAWQFNKKGLIVVKSQESDQSDELELVAIDAGAEDIDADEESLYVYTDIASVESVRTRLEENNLDITATEISMVPKNILQLDSKTSLQTMRLLDSLDEIDDVQKVYSNADYSAEALAQYQSQN
jgi:YebC/PmpR family DNA-binding regulatory protein